MQRRRFLTCAAALGGCAAAPRSSMARRLFPADVTDRYLAFQGDRVIGSQRFSFLRQQGRFVVQARLEMTFNLPGKGGIPYAHESEEIWKTGWLHGLESETRIEDRVRRVHAERDEGVLTVNATDELTVQLSSYVVPSNLWHRDARLVDAYIDVESGRLLFVRPRFVGKETFEQGGETIEASHFRIRGQIQREAWYDEDCVLVRWDLPLMDGSWIRFERQAI